MNCGGNNYSAVVSHYFRSSDFESGVKVIAIEGPLQRMCYNNIDADL